eukprot:CAMPEP_0178955134 /NCGR_PEP_ID=MMETSP0789-20121207/9419_1 /TAXON_ID=3005 /ORGANISM="Rhizosolenia setigera, Strain CCMP 1694" /LENGTH=236 /DNA_ID=CAMNT_0020636697 /DNA_START=195 /DNA_END=905 /DNA_ORIENTATION=-
MSSTTPTTKLDAITSEPDPKNVLRPLVICGPSGVGKSTIISHYMKNYDLGAQFGFTTSHTTREPRPGEVDGVHYHFISREKMEKHISQGHFLEHANVHGNLYGTSFEAMKKVEQTDQKICLLDIDVQGVKNIKRFSLEQQEQQHQQLFHNLPDSMIVKGNYIFIAPPSLEVLLGRLQDRGTETPESLKRRTDNAKSELDYGLQEGNFDYVIENNDLEAACEAFDNAIKALYPEFLR